MLTGIFLCSAAQEGLLLHQTQYGRFYAASGVKANKMPNDWRSGTASKFASSPGQLVQSLNPQFVAMDSKIY
jgi:hypothetical protein